MNAATINGTDLYNLFAGGYQNLKRNEATIDALNVFPVPDGDTGSNMVMTLSGGISSAGSIAAAGEMMTAFSRSCLFTARGNSGVILSQFIRGFANGVAGLEHLQVSDFAAAMQQGVTCAYEAVLNPVEGTILTVMKESSQQLLANFTGDSFPQMFDALVSYMKISLEDTPNKLAVLREAGVVDSGGAGLLCIFEGMQAIAEGKSIASAEPLAQKQEAVMGQLTCDTKLEYGYCTEFILQLMRYKTDIAAFRLSELKKFLESVGDSVVAVQDSDVVKVHVHTFEPEKVLAFAHRYGEFATLKIENMTVQHSEAKQAAPQKKKEHKQFAVVATAAGQGIAEYFESIGADVVIRGGQTQNISAEQFVQAFESLDAEHIVVLPNNGNIIMAAQQAASLYSGADVTVIPNHSIAEGYSALSMIDPFAQTIEEFVGAMTQNLENVSTGYVTTATRDTFMNGINVRKGAYIGLDGDAILCCTDDKLDAVTQTLSAMPNIARKETLILFYGTDVTQEELTQLENDLIKQYPLFDIGVIPGGQTTYSFIMSIE